MRSPAVELADVHFTYPDGRPALHGVSLRVEAGERVALIGPNGSGKSTFCLHLNGILLPQRGSVHVAGLPVAGKDLSAVRRLVGVVFQDPDDMLFMPTVAQDVAFGPGNSGLPEDEVRARVARALEMVGLPDFGGRSPHHLSFGERKRVATAAVLSTEPDVLVLDEPSSNLDPRARREFGEILARYDRTVLMVTHDLPYAAELCDRAVVVDQGRIVGDGPITEVLADDALLARHGLELPAGFSLGILRGT